MTRLKMVVLFTLIPASVSAAGNDVTVSETEYILNSFLLIFCGVLVMFMAAGFTMLESGMVRSKSVAVILTKNISLYAIAGVMFYIIGYNLMYADVDGGFFGKIALWTTDDVDALSGDYSAGSSSASVWFFQMVFVATAASIVSGTLAERIKIWPFFIFTIFLTGCIYPIVGSWKWGGGWLDSLGFLDFAGSTIVHSVGGWAALSGVILLGARRDRFDKDGNSTPIPGSSLPQTTLGTFILWLGWFGFNGGSQLTMGTGSDVVSISNILVNTNIAAAGGVITVILTSQLLYKRLDLPLVLNGALAGLVSITAEPLTPTAGQALFIGGAGALLMMGATRLLDKLKLDDVVGAIPVHLMGGIWGTIAVIFTNSDASLTIQLIGIISVGAFTTLTSFLIWYILKKIMGIRLHWSREDDGGDLHEIGLKAYNLEFGTTILDKK